jgi:hypothetical protein
LQAERARVKGILNAVVPKIEYRSEFHLGTLWGKSLSDARFIWIYFEILSRDRVKAWKRRVKVKINRKKSEEK